MVLVVQVLVIAVVMMVGMVVIILVLVMKVTWHSDVDAPVVAGNITRDGMVVVTVLVVLVVVVVLMVLVVLVDDLALLMKMIGPTTVMGTGNILPAFPFHSYLEPGQCTPD